MNKIRVLFVSTYNGSRSQIAEALLNSLGNGSFTAESAGLLKGELDPAAVEAMKGIGLDISGNTPKNVHDLHKSNGYYNYVIMTSERETLSSCPVFPGADQHIRWSLPNPGRQGNSYDERLEITKKIIREMTNLVKNFISTH